MSWWIKGVSGAFIGGMFLAAFSSVNTFSFLCLASVGILIATAFISEKKVRIGLLVGLIFFWIGGFRSLQEEHRWQTLPEEREFHGVVEVLSVHERGGYALAVILQSLREKSFGTILYQAPLSFEKLPGDRFVFSCHLTRPENFSSDFDYRTYLATQGTGYVCKQGGESGEIQAKNQMRISFLRFQLGVKDKIRSLLPEPASSLLIGLLIGGNEGFAPETKMAFQHAGLSHILAVSGYNMSLVSVTVGVFFLMLGLWRRTAILLATLSIGFFLLLIDGSAASFRAAFMAWLAFGAYFVGRPAASWNALLLVAAVMLFANPLLLLHDIGFQLSFLATTALLVFVRYFETYIFFQTRIGKVVALFLTTLTIEVFTLPVLISTFGMISLISPFANLLVLPLVPLALLAGILVLCVGTFLPFLVPLLLPFAWFLLMSVLWIGEWFGNLPMATLPLDGSASFALSWYLGLGVILWQLEKRRKRYVLGMDH